MKVADAFGGNTIKGPDLKDAPYTGTIQTVTSKEFGKDDEEKKKKLVISFLGFDKDFVCNMTNANTIAGMHGEETDLWIGKVLTLYFDPTVAFGGKLVGGIRVQFTPPGTPSAGAQQAMASAQGINPLHTQPPVLGAPPPAMHPHSTQDQTGQLGDADEPPF